MIRLTMKIEEDFYTALNINSTDDLKYKLGQLEDILEKYGVQNLTDLNVIIAKYFAEVKEDSFRCK